MNLWKAKEIIVIYGGDRIESDLWFYKIGSERFEGEQQQKGHLPIQPGDTNSVTEAVVVNDHMFVFGGVDQDWKAVNRLYSLDLTSLIWT